MDREVKVVAACLATLLHNATHCSLPDKKVRRFLRLTPRRETIDEKSNDFKGYHGSVRCPACGALGSSQTSIDRHILRHRDG